MNRNQLKIKETDSYEFHAVLLFPQTLGVLERRHLRGANLRNQLLNFRLATGHLDKTCFGKRNLIDNRNKNRNANDNKHHSKVSR